MSAYRVLIVDDEPDIRKVVERALARDPDLATRTCASGQDALAAAAEWRPHLVLLDFMMPVMDGPATLSAMRADPATADVPVIFLTARAGSQDLDRLATLGVVGAIAKPFELKALREAVRAHLRASPPAGRVKSEWQPEQVSPEEQAHFRGRMRADAARLNELRAQLQNVCCAPSVLDELRTIVHKLAGAAGLYGFEDVSRSAAALEEALVEAASGRRTTRDASAQVGTFVRAIDTAEPQLNTRLSRIGAAK